MERLAQVMMIAGPVASGAVLGMACNGFVHLGGIETLEL